MKNLNKIKLAVKVFLCVLFIQCIVIADPRMKLIDESSDVFKDVTLFDSKDSKRIPNYLRAFSLRPQAVKPFSEAFATFIYGGTVAPEIKSAMGLLIARSYKSPYVTAHMLRILKTFERGNQLSSAIESNTLQKLNSDEVLALQYAELLNAKVNGVDDEQFRKTRSYFNDSQIVELTMTVSFFNYFTRLCEGLNLPLEKWASEPIAEGGASTSASKYVRHPARIALISNLEIEMTSAAVAQSKDQNRSFGFGMANSQRSMLRVPDITKAWRAYTSLIREGMTITRDIQLQVSFAVSMMNGCRYCTLHQVQGLKRLNIDPAKLISMKKDDSSLTPRELAAVKFARKATEGGGATITDSDWEALKAEFQEIGAFEILIQTCNFSFMNRFTDGLRLPSEDEAVKIYQEVYGSQSIDPKTHKLIETK